MYSPGIGIGIVPRMSGSSVSVVTATVATGIGGTSFTANWNAYTGAEYYLLDVSTSSSFSTFVYQNQIVFAPTTTYVVIGLTENTTYYYRVRASTDLTGIDADWLAYYNRVIAAGGSLTTTEQNATKQLVADLKANSLWTPMKAIYPMVGASAAACAQNLKSSSFTGTFTSGWTFDTTGATPNGTSAYFDTGLIPNTSLGVNNTHLSYYSRTTSVGSTGKSEMGCVNTGGFLPLLQLGIYTNEGGVFDRFLAQMYSYLGSEQINIAGTNSLGYFISSKISSTSFKAYKNNSNIGSTTAAHSVTTMPTNSIYLGAWNEFGVAKKFSDRQCAFSSIGDGLTDTQASAFYTAVQTFQTNLNRNV
jgi:hypothetical protein